ncbi:hypothetical protein [Nocardia sp. XZ_19_385]|uniref:hypothetical protein n=1 Tax=Nocardia sp. XZ_19_385 TaxID=2769488 RepID=UPI00188F3C64|nr:hypothetical protein [Nocardia sp. XZ_19_385]
MDDPALRLPSVAAIHEQILKTVQNLSADRHVLKQRLAQVRNALGPQASYEQASEHQVVGLTHLRDIAMQQASEIGVPAAAVDTAVMRGEQAKRWQRNQPMPRATPADRLHLINGLLQHMREFNNMAAVHRAYIQRFGGSSDNSERYHRATLEALHERIGAVAYALRLTPGEQEFVWGHSEYIVKTMTTHYLDGEESDLVARWDSTATGANWVNESQLGEVLRATGITREAIAAAGQLPPTPQALIAALGPGPSIRGTEATSTPEPGGSEISSAIDAADLTIDGIDPASPGRDPSAGNDPTPPGLDP